MNRKYIRISKAGFIILISVAIMMALITGCNEQGNQNERPASTSSNETQGMNENGVTVDIASQQNSGITVETLKAVHHRRELTAYGTVLGPQGLLEMRNDFVSAKAKVEKARTELDVSQKQFERAKALNAEEKNISDKDLQSALAVWESDKIDVRASEEAMRAVEDAARQQWGNVIAGWLIDGSPAIERLIRQKDLLIQISLPPGTKISEPPATASIADAEENRVTAHFISLSPRADSRTQGMSLLYLVTAGKKGLMPGMNITAYLPVGPEVKGFVVPSSAIVWWNGNAWVYVQKGTGFFVRTEVSTANHVKGGYFVTEGIKEGGGIVVTGAQLLLSEEFRSEFQSPEKD